MSEHFELPTPDQRDPVDLDVPEVVPAHVARREAADEMHELLSNFAATHRCICHGSRHKCLLCEAQALLAEIRARSIR